ncbi:MAG: MarR family winged helix-turn-helix transcriptional regulator [Hyphomicrobiaceae bacterium]
MTDITAPTLGPRTGPAEAAAAELAGETRPDARLVTVVELLFFAYRDFTGEADAVLEEIGLGRAHHRVLHFVYRNPGLRVADLLGILKITKQSLARVLKQLVDDGHVTQSMGERDRRERRLMLTDKGTALARRLIALQTARVAQALSSAGPEAEVLTRDFLFAMIGVDDRAGVATLTRDPEFAA